MGDSVVVHNKIIKSVCKDILLPAGIFQKGTSRVYFDDNGYFLTMIEFQPSSWSSGTYLNIGLSFLWYERDYFAYDFSPFIAARAMDYVDYKNDEQFGRAIKQYAETALKHALNFRNLRNIDYAKQYFEKWNQKRGSWQALEMLNKLDSGELQSTIKRTREFWHSKPSMKKMPYDAIFDN